MTQRQGGPVRWALLGITAWLAQATLTEAQSPPLEVLQVTTTHGDIQSTRNSYPFDREYRIEVSGVHHWGGCDPVSCPNGGGVCTQPGNCPLPNGGSSAQCSYQRFGDAQYLTDDCWNTVFGRSAIRLDVVGYEGVHWGDYNASHVYSLRVPAREGNGTAQFQFRFQDCQPCYPDNWGSLTVKIYDAGGPFFGSDTSVRPDNDEFPIGAPPYDFYAGNVSNNDPDGVSGPITCGIHDKGKDVFGVIPRVDKAGYRCMPDAQGNISPEDCLFMCGTFELPAAKLSRQTYAYWFLWGPQAKNFKSNGKPQQPFTSGFQQGTEMVRQWRLYNSRTVEHDIAGVSVTAPVIGGRTLFADVESTPLQSEFGWCFCPGVGLDLEKHPDKAVTPGSDCSLSGAYEKEWPGLSCLGANRRVLEGFLFAVETAGFPGGVYTSPASWGHTFGYGYRPRSGGEDQDFALWISGCGTGSARTSSEAAVQWPLVRNTVLGGMNSVVWQYQLGPSAPVDFDIASQDPQASFTPVRSPEVAYRCTCTAEGLGGRCPSNQELGTYLDARPDSVEFGSGQESVSVTITNPTARSLGVGRIFIEGQKHSFSQTNACSTLGPGETCRIDVTFDRAKQPKGTALLRIIPPVAPGIAVPLIGCPPGSPGC
jgi:hypothetical protein